MQKVDDLLSLATTLHWIWSLDLLPRRLVTLIQSTVGQYMLLSVPFVCRCQKKPHISIPDHLCLFTVVFTVLWWWLNLVCSRAAWWAIEHPKCERFWWKIFNSLCHVQYSYSCDYFIWQEPLLLCSGTNYVHNWSTSVFYVHSATHRYWWKLYWCAWTLLRCNWHRQ